MNGIKSITMTCSACPTQWEIELADGRWVYARYRWGNLGFGVGKDIGEAIDSYDYGDDIGGDFDGVLDEATMLKHLNKFLTQAKGTE